MDKFRPDPVPPLVYFDELAEFTPEMADAVLARLKTNTVLHVFDNEHVEFIHEWRVDEEADVDPCQRRTLEP